MPPAPDAAGAERTLELTRRFAAPRALVFRAWTDPAHLAAWWGPDGFTLTTLAMDFREGGVWRHVMHGPDGTDYPNCVVFDEIRPPERLVYRHVPEPGAEPVTFITTVTFEEHGWDTELRLVMTFATADQRQLVVDRYGADEGARQMLGRLDAHVRGLAVEDRGGVTR